MLMSEIIDEKTVQDLYAEGIRYFKSYNFEKALNCFQKVVRLDPNNIEAWNEMGNVHIDLWNFERAIECYQKALSIDPKLDKIWKNLDAAHEKLKQYKKAIDDHEKKLSIDEKNVEVLQALKKIESILMTERAN